MIAQWLSKLSRRRPIYDWLVDKGLKAWVTVLTGTDKVKKNVTVVKTVVF